MTSCRVTVGVFPSIEIREDWGVKVRIVEERSWDPSEKILEL